MSSGWAVYNQRTGLDWSRKQFPLLSYTKLKSISLRNTIMHVTSLITVITTEILSPSAATAEHCKNCLRC